MEKKTKKDFTVLEELLDIMYQHFIFSQGMTNSGSDETDFYALHAERSLLRYLRSREVSPEEVYPLALELHYNAQAVSVDKVTLKMYKALFSTLRKEIHMTSLLWPHSEREEYII